MFIFTTVYYTRCMIYCHCVDLIAYLKFRLKSITNVLESQLLFISFIIHRFCLYMVHSHCILQITEVYLPVGFFLSLATLIWTPLAYGLSYVLADLLKRFALLHVHDKDW